MISNRFIWTFGLILLLGLIALWKTSPAQHFETQSFFLSTRPRTPTMVRIGEPEPTFKQIIKQTFEEYGVQFPPGTSIDFEEPSGYLKIRHTSEMLDRIDQLIQMFNSLPPQVAVEIRFINIPKELIPSRISPESGSGNVIDPFTLNQLQDLIKEKKANVLDILESSTICGEEAKQVKTEDRVYVQTYELKNELPRPIKGTHKIGTELSYKPYTTNNTNIVLNLQFTHSFHGNHSGKQDLKLKGRSEKFQKDLPDLKKFSVDKDYKLLNGETIFLGSFEDPKLKKDQTVILLLTADIISPLGRPIASSDPSLNEN